MGISGESVNFVGKKDNGFYMKNKENLKYFNQPDEADKWVWRIENGVGDWVRKQNNKNFWYIVLWESKRADILTKDVTREIFATLLVQECVEALSEGDTVDKIVFSIEKFPFKRHLKEFDKQPDSSFVRKYVDEVSALLTCDVPIIPSAEEISLEQRMHEYLTNATSSETYAKVCIHPIYNGKTATMSVENYVSKRFWDEHRPSHTVIFECVDESLTEEKVEMLYARFGSLSNTKLFIASTHSFSSGVKKAAEHFDIGLVLVNPQHKISEDNFVLPRTRGNQQPEEEQWLRMLVGDEGMVVPILAYDAGRIDDSISYILYKHASFDKKNLFVAAPILSDDEIEAVALNLIKTQVDRYVSLLRQCKPSDKVPVCEIDPYKIAKDMGLMVNRGKIGKKLGHIDNGHKFVTLSSRIKDKDPRDRYSMAHEIGHHIFHQRVSEKAEDGHHHIVPSTKKWLEHHANYFASCLLMPTPVIRLLYAIYWEKEFKNNKVAPLHVKNPYYKDFNFQHVACPIARKMKVSPNAVYIRLKKLGLLFDEP